MFPQSIKTCSTIILLFILADIRKIKIKLGKSTRATLRYASIEFFAYHHNERSCRARPFGGGCRDPTESSFRRFSPREREREKSVTRRAVCCAFADPSSLLFVLSAHLPREPQQPAPASHRRMPRLFSRDATI